MIPVKLHGRFADIVQRMAMWRILFAIVLLGVWAQSASACGDAHVSPAHAQAAIELGAPVLAEDIAPIGERHRCECPAMTQDLRAAVSEPSKSMLALQLECVGASAHSSNPVAVALSTRASALDYVAHHTERPPYLLVPRLRQ